MYKYLSKLVLGLAFFSILATTAQEPAPLTKKETFFKGVYDYANLLNPQQKSQLARKLIRYADTTSTQIAIASVKTLGGQDISMLSVEKAHNWGIGQKGKDNGVFILVAQQERKIHIATGYGVEHLLTDYLSKQIIDNVITPNFKKQQYYQGLDQATDVIIKVLAGEYKASPKNKTSKGKGSLFFLFVIIVLVIFFMNKGGNSGNGKTGNRRKKGLNSSDVLTSFILGSLGSGRGYRGGSGSFGGGGSFGGFGGGGFGGGGASGGW